MDKIEFKNLNGIDIHILTQAFNEAFSDYAIPLQLTEKQLQTKLHSENFSSEFSVGAFEEGRLVGFILHSIDESGLSKLLYNGGTGVIPSHRGQAITQQMYHYIIPILQQNAIDSIELEVLKDNIPAKKSYYTVGFEALATLKCFKGSITTQKVLNNWQIEKTQMPNWDLFKSFWDIQPSWQNRPMAMDKIADHLHLYIAKDVGQLIGYLIVNPTNKRLHQVAVHPEYRRKGVGSSLMQHMVQTVGDEISIINVDEHSEASIQFLNALGLDNSVDQLLMIKKL